jgi:hypothetical protein
MESCTIDFGKRDLVDNFSRIQTFAGSAFVRVGVLHGFGLQAIHCCQCGTGRRTGISFCRRQSA